MNPGRRGQVEGRGRRLKELANETQSSKGPQSVKEFIRKKKKERHLPVKVGSRDKAFGLR